MQKPEAADQQLALGNASGPQTASMNRSGDRAASHNRLPSPRSLLEPSTSDRLMESLLRNQREASGPPTASQPEVIQLEDKRKEEVSQESDSFSIVSGIWHVHEQNLSGSWTQMTESPDNDSSDATGCASGPQTASTEGSSKGPETIPKNERGRGVQNPESNAEAPRFGLETKQDSARANVVLNTPAESDADKGNSKRLSSV